MKYCSRDEAECAFGDDWQSRPMQGDSIGGLFDFVLKPVKKLVQPKVNASLKKQGATPAQLAMYNMIARRAQPTAKDFATGAGKSAIMLAPIVATAGGGALVAPALLAAAPVVKSVAPVVRTASAAVKVATPTIATARSLVSAATKSTPAGKAAAATITATHAAAATGNPAAAAGSLALRLAAAERQPFTSAPLAQVRAPVAVVAKPLAQNPLAAVTASAAALAALQRLNATSPRYLVLDSGQVLAGELAKQTRSGWLVRFDGSVSRNG